jgi:hypothetical protein
LALDLDLFKEMFMTPKIAAFLVGLTIAFSAVPALAAPLQCGDKAIVDFVNAGLRTNATWGDTGKPANSKGPLRIVGVPRAVSATKRTLVCDVRVRHSDPSSGGFEFLTARLTVRLRSDGGVLDAGMIFLEGSR